MTDYLNFPAVRKALNVGDRPWRQSDGQGPSSIGKPVPEHLKPDEMLPISDEVLADLFENYRVMLFVGERILARSEASEPFEHPPPRHFRTPHRDHQHVN